VLRKEREGKSMSPALFDNVAHRYDSTRRYPEAAARQLAEKIDRIAGGNAQTRFFEAGVGTGRFALPLAERGRQYTGIDISLKMLELLEGKLDATHWQKEALAWGSLPDEDVAGSPEVRRFVCQEKQARLRLVIADVTALPFHDNAFDAAIAAHVFHVVQGWQKGLEEMLRVLRPGGVLVRCWDENWGEAWKPGLGDIRKRWTQIVHELGGNTDHPGASDQAVTDWLQQRGLKTEQIDEVAFEQELTPRAVFTSVEQRLWTSTLVVPDDLFATSIQLLRQWMDEQYGSSIDDKYVQTMRVLVNVTRIPE
jgi:ubiquinone/menaquinone biosynthesis C-methylase UbiE